MLENLENESNDTHLPCVHWISKHASYFGFYGVIIVATLQSYICLDVLDLSLMFYGILNHLYKASTSIEV